MGIDSVIYFRATKKPCILEECFVPESVYVKQDNIYSDILDLNKQPDSVKVYELEPYQRYYSKDYPRGHWPTLCRLFLDLLKDDNVLDVYYGGDNEYDFIKVDLNFINEMNEFYIKNK